MDVDPDASSALWCTETPSVAVQLEGKVALPKAGKLMGWAVNPAAPDDHIMLELVADGRVAATFRADRGRQDLREAGKGDHGFKLDLNSLFAAGWPEVFVVRAQHSGEVIKRGRFVTAELHGVDTTGVAADPAPAEAQTRLVQGEVELTSRGVLKGWAWRPDAPHRLLVIEVVVDGLIAGVVHADRYRVAAEKVGIRGGDRAFRYDLPDRFRTGRPVRILVREQATGEILNGGRLSATLASRPEAASRYRYRPDVPKLRAIEDLNSEMGGVVNADRGAWLLQALNISLWSDCLDTARGLARFVDATLEQYSPASQIKLIPRILGAYLATGDREAAKALIRRRLRLVEQDDDAFTIYSALWLERGGVRTDHLTLPSGKLNTYYANAASRENPSQVEAFVAAHPNLLRERPENILLLANMALRKGDEASYRDELDAVLHSHGVTSRLELAPRLRAEPQINRIRFSSRSPAIVEGPLVSVIMAAKNAEATIAASVDSILSQTYQTLELLICDDGSDDATFESVCRRYGGHPKVRLFRSSSSQGPYNIRNHLCQMARGEYLTVQDADDISLPERIEAQLGALLQRPGTLLLHANWLRMLPSGEIPIFLDHHGVRTCTVSTLGRREAFLEYGPYDQVLYGADSQFIEKVRSLAGSHAVASLAKPLLVGSWSDSSLTRSAGSEATEDGFKSADRRRYAEGAFRDRLRGNHRRDARELPHYRSPVAIMAHDSGDAGGAG